MGIHAHNACQAIQANSQNRIGSKLLQSNLAVFCARLIAGVKVSGKSFTQCRFFQNVIAAVEQQDQNQGKTQQDQKKSFGRSLRGVSWNQAFAYRTGAEIGLKYSLRRRERGWRG